LRSAGDRRRAFGPPHSPAHEVRVGCHRPTRGHCLADTTRARELLGFEAETELADGLPELADWVAGQTVTERGDEALAEMRARNLVG
jgi:nucleoside-diphosphate-sugar epimerase